MDRLISEQELLKHFDPREDWVVVQTIKAIPSAEPCEDAISREAVLEKAVYTETEEGWCGYTVDIDYIKSLPSVKPQEPKIGRWIERKNIPKSVDIATANLRWKYECSECEYEVRSKYHFCPNCGARMVEPQEKRCEDCNHYGKFSLDCARCDDDMTNYAPKQADGEYISRTELLKAIDTWDRFGVDDTNSLFRLDNLSLPHYVAYIHYDDVVKCIKGMPSVTPQIDFQELQDRYGDEVPFVVKDMLNGTDERFK